MERPPFRLKVRLGDMEVELGGERDEVLSTLDDLPEIIHKVTLAFNGEPKPRRVTVKKPVEEAPPL